MVLIRTGAILSSELSSSAKIKRAVSQDLDVSAGNVNALFYTSTAVTVLAARAYVTKVVSTNAQTIDIGITGNPDSVVKDASIQTQATDAVVTLALTGTAIAADELVIATISTAAGTGNVIACIEYQEND